MGLCAGPLPLSLTQPVRTGSGPERSLPVSEEMRSLITEKGPGPVEDDPDAIVKALAAPLSPQENRGSPEILEQIYRCNPVLRYTSSPLYAPLLPFPTESEFPGSEMAEYGRFIGAALGKTQVRECVPSLDEIVVLIQRQDMLCTVHCPGTSACTVAISSHTTAEEVARELVARLGLSQSPNVFALYEQNRHHERPVGRATLHYGFLDTENVPRDSVEFALLFEQGAEGSCPQRLWLGIGAKAVSLYKPGEAEPFDSFCYGRISSFGVSESSTFRLSVGDRDLLFECSRVDEIAQLLHTYLTSLGTGQTPPREELANGCRPGNSRDSGLRPPQQRLCPASEPWRHQSSAGSFPI
ncbi:Pleckstrin like proteiny domain-containing family H member 3 [Chelonia mydas]|uniref:Pleckstrin like proteiny domain-containing family H member 3 n=1 Tax=Chelonia mydas TaxID=8469 RepID=M7CHV3_CHEMY|nr:Pleckstrin like proteiny domain-containing family H member 3 [Chelonia mydas]